MKLKEKTYIVMLPLYELELTYHAIKKTQGNHRLKLSNNQLILMTNNLVGVCFARATLKKQFFN